MNWNHTICKMTYILVLLACGISGVSAVDASNPICPADTILCNGTCRTHPAFISHSSDAPNCLVDLHGLQPRQQRRAEVDGRHHHGAGRLLRLDAADTGKCRSWVILACAAAMALGTAAGGWRIIKTMGHKIEDQGFTASPPRLEPPPSSSGATHLGVPISTTHVISSIDHGCRRHRATAGRCAGASPATSSRRGW